MESQHVAGASSQSLQLALGLDGPPLLSNISSVVTDADSGSLSIVDIPLSIATLNGFQPNVAFTSTDDLFASSTSLVFNSISDGGLNKMSDNNFLTSVDAISKNDAKSPLSIMVVSDGLNIQGQISPAISSQPNLTSAPFQSVVSGGDKMLSAVSSLNFNDPEMLGDAAFDSTPSGALPHFDDGLLSTLGSASHGLRLGDGPSGTSFDLFDGGVGDGLSLSPQPFSDAGLISDSTSSVLDAGLVRTPSSDSLLDGSTKQAPVGKKSPASSTVSPDLSSQSKFTNSQCPVCGKTFNNITALAKHRLTHSDERKYICNVCSKGFKRQDHLNGHLMTHLDKKPFECQLPNCDKGYCDQRSLRRHLEQHHHLDPETIQTHVQASMAAAGISPPTPRNGSKSKANDKNSDGRSKPLSSPVYSPGSATPSPSPGAGGNASNIFHFDTKKQQQQQQELLVQQIHQQQKRLLQQQKLQKQQEEQAKVKESVTATVNDAMSKQTQLQLQAQQKQSKQQQNQKQPADMLAVMQEVQKFQQQIKQPQQLEGQKLKGIGDKDTSNLQEGYQWPDKAGIYTFVGTPTPSEQSPASRSDQSPVMPNDLPIRSPVSPASAQPISPMTTAGTRAVWFNNSPDTTNSVVKEEPPKPQAYCTACDRYFKNAAALNGHMRCHGGFNKKGKGLENKKSPVRKSSTSSEMGPPLRRPPHTSTPSPQPIARTSPTTPPCSTSPQTPLTPTSIQSPSDQSSAIDRLNGATSSDQLSQSKHKLLQEQLSSHLLKRRMSGDQFQQRRQLKQQQQQQAQALQEDMKLLEEHIKAQRQMQQQQSPQNAQVLSNQARQQEIPLQIGLSSSLDRPVSPQQGEHIQRLVQSFQQVEELHLQQQQQQQQIQLSPEQLEQIRQEHKLLGLPPLNPEQLQFQLQEQQNQIIQAQIREQQLQEQHQQQQQQNQLQVMEPASLVMSPASLAQSGLIQFSSTQASNINNQQQPLLKVNYQPTDVTDANQITMPSQTELNSSVQHILATLDPIVVNAAGLNHQQLLAQLQKHQLSQPDLSGMQFTVDPQNAELVTDALTTLQVGQIPQILLQPPDPDDINGVPTISIPESVVLGAGQATAQQPNAMETEQQQIERIQNGLMASVKQQQDSRLAGMPVTDIANMSYVEDMESRVPNFLNIQPNRVISNTATHAAIAPQSIQSQLRDSNIIDGSSTQNDITLPMNVSSSSSISSSATSSAVARNTDAAVAQILKNISNSMAESTGIVLSLGGSEAQPSRTIHTSSPLDGSEDKMSPYHMSSSPKHFLESIKQDVMLSSAINSNREKKTSSFSSDTVMKEVPYSYSSADKKLDSNASSKRRLSADLESQRKISSLSRNNNASINPLTTMVNPLEVEGITAGRVRARSKSGDVHYKYSRSKSVDQSLSRPFSISEDSMFRPDQRRGLSGKDVNSHEHDVFSRSDGAGVFRNPSSLPSPLKIKRKHRPAPLYIPPQFGIFQSRLRSPRVISKDGHLTGEVGRGHTPPPYTPPPMLSPFRSGSGLFCSLQSAPPCTPGSAPVSGKFSQSSRASLSSAKHEGGVDPFADQVIDETPPPETDTLAHINVGADYQAVLPERRAKDRADRDGFFNDKNSLLWHPSSESDNTDNQLQHYQEFSCSAAVKGNGCNVEYALHLLHLVKGDLNEALLLLMGEPPSLPVDHPMLSYKYQESDSWNANEMAKFYKGILDHDKDFFKISKEVETKTVKQCVQFYYVWKKVCPDDYKRLRHSRNKQTEYNTRKQAEKAAAAERAAQAVMMSAQEETNNFSVPSNVQDDVQEEFIDSDNTSFVSDNEDAHSTAMSGPGTAPSTANSTPTRVESPASVTTITFPCTHEGCNVTCSSKQSLKRHMRKHQEKVQTNSPSTVRKPRPSTPSRSPVYDQCGEEIFPCRLCGRVFAKVKSRSAHMKSHKIAEQAQQEKRAAELASEVSAFVG